MRDYAKRRDWTVALEIRDIGSGANARPKREELLLAARRRELDVILVWRLDRCRRLEHSLWSQGLRRAFPRVQRITGISPEDPLRRKPA